MNRTKKLSILLFVLLSSIGGHVKGQELSIYLENLTTPEYVEAVAKSEGVCLLPLGIMEKHGPHMPLGTDLYIARETARRAAEKEYCVIFPPYYFGQINEAKHQPGTFAYSHDVIWNLLQETCDELARNGFKKIILVNGHGGNNDFLRYFCFSQLESKKDYSLVFFQPQPDSVFMDKTKDMRRPDQEGHAGHGETSLMHRLNEDFVRSDQVNAQSGKDQGRLDHIPNQYSGIWWYARYPNHYAGSGEGSDPKFGELLFESTATQLAELVKTLKTDDSIKKLQDEFYEQAADPLKTGQ